MSSLWREGWFVLSVLLTLGFALGLCQPSAAEDEPKSRSATDLYEAGDYAGALRLWRKEAAKARRR